jgi:hypothetical protein
VIPTLVILSITSPWCMRAGKPRSNRWQRILWWIPLMFYSKKKGDFSRPKYIGVPRVRGTHLCKSERARPQNHYARTQTAELENSKPSVVCSLCRLPHIKPSAV